MPDAAKILLHNVYGWFDRVERGLYGLTTRPGIKALERWPQRRQEPADGARAIRRAAAYGALRNY